MVFVNELQKTNKYNITKMQGKLFLFKHFWKNEICDNSKCFNITI